MIMIFVLLIFTISQFILSNILTDQSSELQDLHPDCRNYGIAGPGGAEK
jgi:hypothetical protein